MKVRFKGTILNTFVAVIFENKIYRYKNIDYDNILEPIGHILKVKKTKTPEQIEQIEQKIKKSKIKTF